MCIRDSIDDVIVMHMADGLYWVSDLYGPRLLPWIEKHKGTADIQTKIITYDWDMYAIQGPDSINAMNAMLDKPIDELKRFGICERKIGDIPVYIHPVSYTHLDVYKRQMCDHCSNLFLCYTMIFCILKMIF